MKINRALIAAAVAALFACSAFAQTGQPAANSCEALAKLAIPQAKITSAQSVAAGALTMPTPGSAAQAAAATAFFKSLPAFCRIAVDSTPSSDSDIKIEVWLPASGLERKISGSGQRRFRRLDRLSLHGHCHHSGLRHRQHRHRPHRSSRRPRRRVGAQPSRKNN